jgi:hypothetical protein
MFSTQEWRPGRFGSDALVTEWKEWLQPTRQWISAHLLTSAADITKSCEFWQALAFPRYSGGRSLAEHMEFMHGTNARASLGLNLPALYHQIEENLKLEGRWQHYGLFVNPLLNSLSLGHVLMLLANEGVIETLTALTIDVLPVALAILDAIKNEQVEPDEEGWQILLAFIRQYSDHARRREAVSYLVGDAAQRPVHLREDLYATLLVVCQGAQYVESTGSANTITVLDCLGWLRSVLLTEVPDEELEGFLDTLAAAIDSHLAATGSTGQIRDDRFVRVLLDYANVHPEEAHRYNAARVATGHYLALDGIGASDPGSLLFSARFFELCALTVSCLNWDHSLADPSNQLANELAQLLGRLGLLETGLEAIDWPAVEADARKRVTDALVADAGGLHNPADAYNSTTGVYDLRGSEQYLLVLAGLELEASSETRPTLPAGIRERLDPFSASAYLKKLETYWDIVKNILEDEPKAALDHAIKAKFGQTSTPHSVAVFHANRLLDPRTAAWAATLSPTDRKNLMDTRIAPILAVDQTLGLDVSAKFGCLVSEFDPISLLDDLTNTERDNFADLVADTAPTEVNKTDLKKLLKSLVDLNKSGVYLGRAWIQLTEKSLNLTEQEYRTAMLRLFQIKIHKHMNWQAQITKLQDETLSVGRSLSAMDGWKIGVRGFGAIVAGCAIVIRFTKDDKGLLDWALILKDFASLLDHIGSVLGSRLIFNFGTKGKILSRVLGRIAAPIVDYMVCIVAFYSSLEHFERGEYEEGTVDLIYAGVALTSAVVGGYVLYSAGVTLESPPLALIILAVGGLVTIGLAVYETYFLEPALAQAFMQGLEGWLMAVRIVYPEHTALYPPTLPSTGTIIAGSPGFYGDRPEQDPVRIDWDAGLHLNNPVHEGDLLGIFIQADEPSWDGAFEFRSPLSGTLFDFGRGGVFSSGDPVLYLIPDFSDRFQELD